MAVNRGIYDDHSDVYFYLTKFDSSDPYAGMSTNKRRKRNRRINVFERDGFMCVDCKRVFEVPVDWDGEFIEGLTMGHIVPRNDGGTFTYDNLISQCEKCNNDLADRVWFVGWREVYEVPFRRYDNRSKRRSQRVWTSESLANA